MKKTMGILRTSVLLLAAAMASLALVAPAAAWRGHLSIPLGFEPNEGRAEGEFAFLSRVPGYALFLAPGEAVLVLHRPTPSETFDMVSGRAKDNVLRMRLIGADASAPITGLEALPGKVNYFVGRDPQRWRTSIPTFAKVRAEGVYPGVDVVYYGREGSLEFDFVVAAGGDPGAIRLGFRGARNVEVESSGDLILAVAGQRLRMRKPVVYQERDGARRQIPGRYAVVTPSGSDGASGETQLAFRVGAYDPSRPLVIDPVLVYSTYLGGTAEDSGQRIALDAAGNVYLTGRTTSTNFPTASPLQSSNAGGFDAFVTKIDASGSVILYSTYLGGSGDDEGKSIAVDASGSVYVAGQTASSNFPTVNAFQSIFGGGGIDAFVAKLDATGSALVYSTYLGGTGTDTATGIAVDPSGDVYATGNTRSLDFPTSNPVQLALAGGQDGFVTKLDASGTSLVYSTYLGGSSTDVSRDIAVTANGEAVVVGNTFSANFPTVNALQSSFGGFTDAFMTKLTASGGIAYSTYLGGSAGDQAMSVAVDGTGNAYVVGGTASANFPVFNAVQSTSGGASDAFVTKINAAGSALVYSTFLGGSSGDMGNSIALDGRNNVYVTGFTLSANFPIVNAIQAAPGGGLDAFVTKINQSGTALSYSTYVGGSSTDQGNEIAVDENGDAYVTGVTNSSNFPVVAPLQAALAGGQDGFVMKLSFPAQEQIQALIGEMQALVAAGVLNQGQGNALTIKLQAALSAVNGGNATAATTQLQAFIDQVNAFVNAGILTSAEGQVLIDGANDVIAVLAP